VFLARWPAHKANRHARERIRSITARSRLLVPVEQIVEELNMFLRGQWVTVQRSMCAKG
jgi:RNA-directed DNA polymerase